MVCKYLIECSKVVDNTSETELKAKCLADSEEAMYEQNCCHSYIVKSSC